MDLAVAPDFHSALADAKARVEKKLTALLPRGEADVIEAMRYASLGGGKRLRALLVIESARLFDVASAEADLAAAAVECIHAYSLIHDDLPCMDNDDLRHGRPTVHVKWNDATAVLAGDALQSLAFDILAGHDTSPDADIRLSLIHRLAMAAGAQGMIRGQALDIAAETVETPLDLQQIDRLQNLKTGALIRWAAEAGAILGRADPDPLGHFAGNLGLAFQIRDDILDIEGNERDTGKRVGKDIGANKATFVSILGVEGAKERARQLIDSANEALSPYGQAANTLRQVAEFTISRKS